MIALRLIWQDPALRLAAALMLLTGTLWATFGPFLALLAVETFQLGNQGYAAVLAIATGVGVVASLAIGIRADQRASRRRIALATCLTASLAMALMTVAPNPASFVLVHTLLYPVASTIFGQVFALARLAAADKSPEDRQSIISGVRAAVSLPFLIILPLWSLALSHGTALTMIYPIALVFSLLMLAAVQRYWPADGRANGRDTPSGLSLRAALAELANRELVLRLAALGAIASMPTLYMMTVALILTQIGGRGASDPALFFGLVAGAEVPAMFFMAHLGRTVARLPLLMLGTVLSMAFLLALPLLAHSPLVWALILPLALGHGVILTVPITYLQDLLANRPGTGTALIALQGLISNLLAAAAFALGAALWGYELVMIFGAAIGLSGALILWRADRHANRSSILT